MIFLVEGKKESVIREVEGQKQVVILKVEGEKQRQIFIVEGQVEVIRKVFEVFRMVDEKYFMFQYIEKFFDFVKYGNFIVLYDIEVFIGLLRIFQKVKDMLFFQLLKNEKEEFQGSGENSEEFEKFKDMME